MKVSKAIATCLSLQFVLRIYGFLLTTTTCEVVEAFSSPAFVQGSNRGQSTRQPQNRRDSSILFVSETGIETGVIKGIKEDSEEIDFGRCGVKLAEETAVRVSGKVTQAPASAEWMELDNILKLTPVHEIDVSSLEGFKIIGEASAAENYKDPGQGTIKEVIYAPEECAKKILQQMNFNAVDAGIKRIVVNVAGGNDLNLSEVMDAIVKISAEFHLQGFPTDSIRWNSLSFKEFTSGQASMLVVEVTNDLERGEEEPSESLSGLATGELYMHAGKYFTVSDEDIITNFSEDWMV